MRLIVARTRPGRVIGRKYYYNIPTPAIDIRPVIGYNIRMTTPRTISDRLFSLLASATRLDYQAANAWYTEANAFAATLCVVRPEWNMEVACSVVSAFSPRVTWGHNKAKAFQYAQGITPRGLRSHIAAADRCVLDGFDGLRGAKTNAFARAIAGDKDAVVVDVWMCRAAGLVHARGAKVGMPKDAPNKTEYRAIAQAVRNVAASNNMDAATMQALLWIIIRGKAD